AATRSGALPRAVHKLTIAPFPTTPTIPASKHAPPQPHTSATIAHSPPHQPENSAIQDPSTAVWATPLPRPATRPTRHTKMFHVEHFTAPTNVPRGTFQRDNNVPRGTFISSHRDDRPLALRLQRRREQAMAHRRLLRRHASREPLQRLARRHFMHEPRQHLRETIRKSKFKIRSRDRLERRLVADLQSLPDLLFPAVFQHFQHFGLARRPARRCAGSVDFDIPRIPLPRRDAEGF